MFRRSKASTACLAGILLWLPCARSADIKTLFSERFTQPLEDRWKPIKFHGLTDYRIVTDSPSNCLEARADASCSALAIEVNLQAANDVTCAWQWKIDRSPTNGSDVAISTFDHSARVFVAFDTFFGPPRTINCVWANRAAINAAFNHPFSSRTKFIAVESGDQKAGRWIGEQRNVSKDWARLFKTRPMPRIAAIGVFTDSHATRDSVTAWYRNIAVRENSSTTVAADKAR